MFLLQALIHPIAVMSPPPMLLYPTAQCPFPLELCKGPDGIPSVLTDSYKHPTLKDMYTVHSAFITFDLKKNNLFVFYIFNLDMNFPRILAIYLHSSVQCLRWGAHPQYVH